MENKSQLKVRMRRVLEKPPCPEIIGVKWGRYMLRRSYLGKQEVILDLGERTVGYYFHLLINLRRGGIVTIAKPRMGDRYAPVQFVMEWGISTTCVLIGMKKKVGGSSR